MYATFKKETVVILILVFGTWVKIFYKKNVLLDMTYEKICSNYNLS